MIATALLALVFSGGYPPMPQWPAFFDTEHRFVGGPVGMSGVEYFGDPAIAHAHCPADRIVWLDPGRSRYYVRGMRRFGQTPGGAFVCREEAESVDDRLASPQDARR